MGLAFLTVLDPQGTVHIAREKRVGRWVQWFANPRGVVGFPPAMCHWAEHLRLVPRSRERGTDVFGGKRNRGIKPVRVSFPSIR